MIYSAVVCDLYRYLTAYGCCKHLYLYTNDLVASSLSATVKIYIKTFL